MRTKKSLFYSVVILAVALSLMLVKADTSWAKSMTLKVSHQFAAGDVRDQMGRVFGDMVTKRTNGEIKFRHYPAKSLFKPKEQWDALRKGAGSFSLKFRDHFFAKPESYDLKEEAMLVVARNPGQEPPLENWVRYYSVENSVFSGNSAVDFLKISKRGAFQDHDRLCAYLFSPGQQGPSPFDSLRELGYLQPANRWFFGSTLHFKTDSITKVMLSGTV